MHQLCQLQMHLQVCSSKGWMKLFTFLFLLLTLLLFFWFSHWSYKCTHWASYNCTYRYVLYKRFNETIHFFCFFCSLCCYSFGLDTGATNAPTEPATNAPTGKFLKTLFETFHFFFLRGLTLLLFFWFSHWSYKCTYWASYNCTYRYVFEKVGWDLPLFLSSSAHFAAILLT